MQIEVKMLQNRFAECDLQMEQLQRRGEEAEKMLKPCIRL